MAIYDLTIGVPTFMKESWAESSSIAVNSNMSVTYDGYCATLTNNASSNGGAWINNTPFPSTISGNTSDTAQILYICAEARGYSTNTVGAARFWYRRHINGSTDITNAAMTTLNGEMDVPNDNKWYILSARPTTFSNGNFYEYLALCPVIYPSNGVGDKASFRNVKVFNLTEIYGHGNEPSKEWCDKNLTGSGLLTNLTMARTANFTNMDAPTKEVFTFKAGQLALIQGSMIKPKYGHKYYGRCYQKSPAGHTWGDARFEYYAEDVAGTGLLVFGYMEPTNNEWKILSSIQTLTGEPTGENWYLRSFVSGGNADSYRKEMMIIDLTESFGPGNEPTKEWCDVNIPFFEGELTIIPDLKVGDTINCPYSGKRQGILLHKGKYLLETYGAQGGTYNTAAPGGKGGYTRGALKLYKDTGLLVYAGGQGVAYGTSTYTSQGGGGFNGGGGAGYRGGGGGGASDIRISYDSLYARVLVAGGGGGSHYYSATYKASGGTGGGAIGTKGNAYSTSYATWVGNAGSLIAGGTGGAGSSANYNGKAGSFGQGGNTGYKYNSTSYHSNGAGGGGWYGGGAAGNYSSSSHTRSCGGGGGSAYYYNADTAQFYPDNCLLKTDDYLQGCLLKTGVQSGNGYCSITVLSNNTLDDTVYLGDQSIESLVLGEDNIKEIFLGEHQITPKLPTFLNYIELKGNQYIDTGYKPSSKTTFEIDIEITSLNGKSTTDSWFPMFGTRDTSTSPCINSFASFHSATANTSVSFVYGNTDNTTIATTSSVLGRNTIKIDKNIYYFNNTAIFTATENTFAAAQSLVIGSIKNIGGDVDGRRLFAKIYSIKIWDNGVLIKHYKPALDNNKTICLYETINREYYYSLGTEELYSEDAFETVVHVNRSILDEGSFVNVTPTYLTGQQNGSDGFTIVGRNSGASGSATYAGDLKWEYDIDLTNVEELIFYCKKGANHGICKICIDGVQKLWVHYNDLPTAWTQYKIDLRTYTGTHKIGFVGGYTDSTGNTSSSTSYCDIKFVRRK